MSLFNSMSIKVMRSNGEPVNNKGRLVAFQPVEFRISGTIQPIETEEMKSSRFLQDSKEAYTLFSRTKLLASDSGEVHGDKVEINAKIFEVVSCRDWNNRLIPHYEMLVKR